MPNKFDPVNELLDKMSKEELKLLCDGLLGVIGVCVPYVAPLTPHLLARMHFDHMNPEKKPAVQKALDFADEIGTMIQAQQAQEKAAVRSSRLSGDN